MKKKCTTGKPQINVPYQYRCRNPQYNAAGKPNPATCNEDYTPWVYPRNKNLVPHKKINVIYRINTIWYINKGQKLHLDRHRKSICKKKNHHPFMIK